MNRIKRKIEDNYIQWMEDYATMSIRESTKFVKGEDTGVPCITFYVANKGHQEEESKRIPEKFDNMFTDVVELKTPDYVLGSTSMTDKSPEEQRRKSSGVKRK